MGIPATILDKPGPVTGTEFERIRLAAYYTERTLARPAALARIGSIASMANERLDGSGYHRGLAATAVPAARRIPAPAHAYYALDRVPPSRHPPSHNPAAV